MTHPPWIKITGQPSAWVGLVVVTEKLWSTMIRIIRNERGFSKKAFEAILLSTGVDQLT